MPDALLIFRCKHCDAPIGAQTDAALIIGGVRFYLAVTMTCQLCNRDVKWRPVIKVSFDRGEASKGVARSNAAGVESEQGCKSFT